jgi:hypothetical protein
MSKKVQRSQTNAIIERLNKNAIQQSEVQVPKLKQLAEIGNAKDISTYITRNQVEDSDILRVLNHEAELKTDEGKAAVYCIFKALKMIVLDHNTTQYDLTRATIHDNQDYCLGELLSDSSDSD